jgi:hypothetical protein
MASRSLTTADPILAEKFLLLQEAYSREFSPWYLQITCVHRDPAEQRALYAQGREALDIVNSLRRASGLPPITTEANSRKVTWTLRSKHMAMPARAIDVVPMTEEADFTGVLKAHVDFNDLTRFKPLVSLAKQFGLVSGGSWTPPDWPHLELPPEPPLIERA